MFVISLFLLFFCFPIFSYASECQPILDPILSMYNPSCYFGGVSELFRKNVKDYMNCDPDHRLVDDDEDDEEPPKYVDVVFWFIC